MVLLQLPGVEFSAFLFCTTRYLQFLQLLHLQCTCTCSTCSFLHGASVAVPAIIIPVPVPASGQKNYHPVPVELQAVILWAVQNDFFDKIPVDKIKDFQTKLSDFLTTRQEAILAQLREKGAFDDDITKKLKAVVGEFAETYV